MNLLVKRALDHAAVWHVGQKRKYPGGIDVPYMSHAAGVALVLARHGLDAEVVAAGALHDVIEDCGVAHEELTRMFGARVADLVADVSEPDKSLLWEARKRHYVERFAVARWDAQAISLADKVDNLSSIAVSALEHGDPWTMFKRGKETQLAYFDAMARAAAALPPHALVDEFNEALAAIRAM